jgi:hypothetical protein
VDLPFGVPFASNFWMKVGYFSRRTRLYKLFGPNLYVLALFLSKQIPKSMEEREEDLFFLLYLHTSMIVFFNKI